ncbi:hypothetical protein GVAV_003215 [Gurleya vavrai]
MNNIIDEIDDSELIKILEKSFLGNDKISGRYISEFKPKDSLINENYPFEHFKPNFEGINNERLIYKKAYAFQNIFFCILNQTRYEIIYNLIDTRKDFDIIVSWYQHNNCLQNSEKISKFLENFIKYESNHTFEFKDYEVLKFI